MMSLLEMKGNRQFVSGHNPLWIADSSQIFICTSGLVDVFCVFKRDETRNGRRHHVMRLANQELTFGLPITSQSDSYQLMLLGVGEAEVLIVDRENLNAEIVEGSHEFKEAFELWTEKIHDFFLEGMTSIPRIESNEELLSLESEALNTYLEMVSHKILEKITARNESEIHQYQARFNHDEKLYAHAFSILKNLVESQEPEHLFDNHENNLLNAFKVISTFLYQNEGDVNTNHLKTEESKVSIEVLSRAHRLRVRQVVLDKNWWRQDNGPLIGFLNSDQDVPIALLPTKGNKYEMVDCEKGTRMVVNESNVMQLKDNAFAIYKLLQDEWHDGIDFFKAGLLSGWKADVIRIAVMGIVIALIGLLFPIISGVLFDYVIPMDHSGQIWQLAFILFFSVVASGLFQAVKMFSMMRIATKMTVSLQAAIWDRLVSLPTSFFKTCSSGEMVERAMGVDSIRKIATDSVLSVIMNSVFSIVTLGLMIYYDWKLSILVLGITGVSVLFMGYMGHRKISYQRHATEQLNRNNGFFIQIIDGIAKMKIAGAEKRLFYLWTKRFVAHRELSFKAKQLSNMIESFAIALPLLASLMVFAFYLGSVGEKLSLGNFIAFNTAFTLFFSSLLMTTGIGINMLAAIPHYENLMPILMAKPEFDAIKEDPGILKGEIELNHVYFKYDKDQPFVIKDVSLKIDKGEYVAIVGPSGSGKSTLLRILLGFEQVASGNVYYDSKSMENLDITRIRKQIGVVLQNGRLLSGNILGNIVGSSPNASMDDAWVAAKAAGIADDIEEMPMGMFTVISEGKGTLSGGQKQRLLIARALVGQPRILLFDEATSALDNITQSLVSETLEKLDATRIVIAHRLSTIMACNRIIVLDKGTIVESGTYEELMKNKSVFYELAHRQQY